jgi:hypothetical protein
MTALFADTNYNPQASFKAQMDSAATARTLSEKEKKKIYGQVISQIDEFPDLVTKNTPESIEAALKLSNTAFDMKNWGIISQFDRENGQQHVAYDRLTSRKVADAAWNLGQQGHPKAWTQYADFTEHSAVSLLKTSIADIQRLESLRTGEQALPHGAERMRGAADPTATNPFRNTYVSWNDKISKWEFHSDIPSARRQPQYEKRRTKTGAEFETTYNPFTFHAANPNSFTRDQIEAAVNRANSVLDNLKTIPEHEKKDVNSYLLDMMINKVGMDPTAQGISISSGLLESMISTQRKKQP